MSSSGTAPVRTTTTELPGWREVLVGSAVAVYLEALWLAGCLLVVTAPSATTAMFAAVHRWRVDGELPGARRYVLDVRARLAPDLQTGFVGALVVTFLAVDLIAIGHMGAQRRVVLVLWLAVTVGLALCAVFAPVAAAAGSRGPRVTLRNGAVAALRRPLHAVGAVLLVAALAALVTVSPICLLAAGVAAAAAVDRLASGPARRERGPEARPASAGTERR